MRGSDRHGLKSLEDQVSTDIRDVVQASEPDVVARGVTIDLLQMAKRVGLQCEAPNTRICPWRKVPPRAASLLTIEGAIEPFLDNTVELSMKAPISVSKPADLG